MRSEPTLSPASQPSFNDETACVALIRALVMREDDDASEDDDEMSV